MSSRPVAAIADHPALTSIDRALARAAAIAPVEEAIVCGEQRITYGELAARVGRTMAALARLGVRRGDHVGICLGNGVDWATLFLAAGSLGAVTVPVNTRLKADEIGYMLRQSEVSVLFVADRFLGIDFMAMLRRLCPAIDAALPDPAMPRLRQVVILGQEVPPGAMAHRRFLEAAAADPLPPPACGPDDVLLIQYTSGTTSMPKGAMLTHAGMLGNGWFAGRYFGLRAGDRYFSPRPFFHVAGSTLSLLASLQYAATLVTVERFEPASALAVMEAERCTLVSGNDTIFLMLLNHPDRARRRLCLRGGWAAASPAVMTRIVEQLGAGEMVVAYGLSEASPNVAMSAWWDSLEDRVGGRLRLQPGVAVEIRDPESGTALAPDAAGEIFVRGWSVMRGYYGKPAETAAALDASGWLRTGDLGRMSAVGRLSFVGRAKDIIRVGGENVAMADIEDTLHKHPEILQAQVVGVPDPRLSEVPAAFVILVPGKTLTPAALIEWCRDRMAGFKVPRHVRIVTSFEEIGMTASSKVQKRHLAEYAVRVLGLGPAGQA